MRGASANLVPARQTYDRVAPPGRRQYRRSPARPATDRSRGEQSHDRQAPLFFDEAVNGFPKEEHEIAEPTGQGRAALRRSNPWSINGCRRAGRGAGLSDQHLGVEFVAPAPALSRVNLATCGFASTCAMISLRRSGRRLIEVRIPALCDARSAADILHEHLKLERRVRRWRATLATCRFRSVTFQSGISRREIPGLRRG